MERWNDPQGRCEPLTVCDEFSRFALDVRSLANVRTEQVRRFFESLPEYVNSDATTGAPPETKQASLVSPTNKLFGRKMKIVSFRWLNSFEI